MHPKLANKQMSIFGWGGVQGYAITISMSVCVVLSASFAVLEMQLVWCGWAWTSSSKPHLDTLHYSISMRPPYKSPREPLVVLLASHAKPRFRKLSTYLLCHCCTRVHTNGDTQCNPNPEHEIQKRRTYTPTNAKLSLSTSVLLSQSPLLSTCIQSEKSHLFPQLCYRWKKMQQTWRRGALLCLHKAIFRTKVSHFSVSYWLWVFYFLH